MAILLSFEIITLFHFQNFIVNGVLLLFQSFLTDFDKLERHLSTEGKVVIDLNDPDHPRFTLSELRDILQERNELKTKVIALEEELQQYKPELVCLSVLLTFLLSMRR